jgi:hypothetical protein
LQAAALVNEKHMFTHEQWREKKNKDRRSRIHRKEVDKDEEDVHTCVLALSTLGKFQQVNQQQESA